MIERIFQRIEKVTAINQVTLATTSDSYNQALIDWASKANKNIYAYHGDVNDLVTRVNTIVVQQNPDVVVYCCGDSPLIEPVTVSRMIAALIASPGVDAVKLQSAANGKAYIHEGFSVYRRSVWDRMVKESITPEEKEHVGVALNRFVHQLAVIEVAEEPVYAVLQHRISVDTVADYRFMQQIYNRWYLDHSPDSLVSLKWVIASLENDAQLKSINAHVQQKSATEISKRILVVTQVGKTVGLGHLRRSIVLLQALQETAKANAVLWIYGKKLELHDLSFIPHKFHPEGSDFCEGVLSMVDTFGPETIIFDIAENYNTVFQSWQQSLLQLLQQLRRQNLNLVAIDGLLNSIDIVDLVYVPSFYLDPVYNSPRYQQKITHGWDTYLLKKPPYTGKWQKGNNVIVLTGGSDTTCLAHHLPLQLDSALPSNTTVHWVKGPFANAPSIPAYTQLQWIIHDSPDDIYPIAVQMNYALSVYGVSFFEMIQLGLPCVVFDPYLDGLSQELVALSEEDIAMVADKGSHAVNCLAVLMKDDALSISLAATAKNTITNAGVTAFVQRLTSLSHR